MKHISDFIINLTGLCSTILFVFCGIFYSSNKTWFIWSLFGGIIFGLFTGFLIWQNEIWKNQTNAVQNNLIPDVSCLMEYPIKAKEDNAFRDTNNPTIIITNSGPIAAISLSAKINIYMYSTKENNIIKYIKSGFINTDHTISANKLEPFGNLKQSTIGISGNDIIAVYFINH